MCVRAVLGACYLEMSCSEMGTTDHSMLLCSLHLCRSTFSYCEEGNISLCMKLVSCDLMRHHRSEFPSETVHILTAHSDEVWFLAFSRDGSRLASGAKDGEIILWNMQVCVYMLVYIVTQEFV